MAIPPLKDDCFAMPAGVDWTPVDVALQQIQQGLHCVVDVEDVEIAQAGGRVLAQDIVALRPNPPKENSAVDGYGFCFTSCSGTDIEALPIQAGVSAAGTPFEGQVKQGHALRILTGATIPAGVDTVVLDEDIVIENGAIHFRKGLRQGANIRRAGEDFANGDVCLVRGRRLMAQDLALATAAGISRVSVFRRLRVAVISTGTEIVQAGQVARSDQIFDANKPMLLELLKAWGFAAIDGGNFEDHPDIIRAGFDAAAKNADAILVTGGASAGDEDYVSALLKSEGVLQTWRVAVKPGRPIAMALWDGVPTFGFPGNPVAAFVCALIFGLPALRVLSGQSHERLMSFQVPAAFQKNKKAGRREYLRARLTDKGTVEPFQSEGSGRISGLSWATGLIELADDARDIKQGDLVTYIPFSAFGI